MKRFLLINLLLICSIATMPCFANQEQEKIYLVQILNQLNAIQPLVLAAAKEQPNNTRLQFHYSQYRDGQGQLRNGLFEDIQAIKKGIEQKLNQISIEPRTVAPIKGDYINLNNEVNHS